MESYNIVIVGAGENSCGLIESLQGDDRVVLCGVVDANETAPGIKAARNLKIPTYSKLDEICQDKTINFIIDNSDDKQVRDLILEKKVPEIILLSGASAKLVKHLIGKQKRAEAQAIYSMSDNIVEGQFKDHYILQEAMSALLRVSLAEVPLVGILLKALNIILSIPIFSFEAKGCIFVVNSNNKNLEMMAHKGLSEELVEDCATVEYGECICGKAALSRQSEFVNAITSEHKDFSGMSPHGHYCVPIISSGVLLGVLNLYVKAEHIRTKKEDEFLKSMANTLAGVIKRKQTEELLFRSNIRLEKTLLELEETQEIIIQRECLAAVGQLAAGVAHDFNNLLSTMIGTAEIMNLSDNISEEARQGFSTIIEQGFKAAELVAQIMDFSRQSVSKMQAVNLVSAIAKTIRLLRRTLPEKIELIFNHEGISNCFVKADDTQLQQVFLNLAINARDAMPDGGKISFLMERFVLGKEMTPPYLGMSIGAWWLTKIEDNGTGMDALTLKKIFEPFFSTKGEAGTGLGLAQVYGLIKKHGGFITVESEKGKGTTFNIYLPVVDAEESNEDIKIQQSVSEGKGETVLLVEDSAALLDVTEKMIEVLGYKTITATNGKDALAKYIEHRHEISLVLTDMVMPIMDGAQLFRELKNIDSNVKVVIMTGYAGHEDGKELLEKGLVDWMNKPVKAVELAKVLRKIVRKNK